MDYRTKSKYGFWAVILIVALNVTLMGILWYQHYKSPPQEARNSRPEREAFFARELQLDQQQADSVRILRNMHFRQKEATQQETTLLSQQIMAELFAPQSDSILVRKLCAEIGQLQMDAELDIYNHFTEIKKLCRPEQYERLKTLIFDLIRSQQLPPPPGEHRPPPPDGRRPPQGAPGEPPPGTGNQPPPPDGR